MFKRFVAFLTVLFLGLVLTVRSPVNAASPVSIPFSSIKNLIDAFYTIASGGTIDIATVFGKVTGIDSFLNGLENYYNKTHNNNSNYSTGLTNSLLYQMGALALQGVDNVTDFNQISFSSTAYDLANFIGYNANWFYNYVSDEVIEVNPDPFYMGYLNRINLRDSNDATSFWWYNFTDSYFINNNNTIYLLAYPPSNYSWVSYTNNTFPSVVGNFSTNSCIATDLLDIYINYDNGVYSYSTTATSISRAITNTYGGTWNIVMLNYNNGVSTITGNGNDTLYSVTWSYSNSDLSLVLNHIANHFKNVNIYVNNTLWSYAGIVPVNGITVNPIPIGDTGDVTYKAYPIDADGAKGIDLFSWANKLYDYIIANPDGTLSMDDVIDNEWDIVDTDEGLDTITNDDAEDISKVINGAISITGGQTTPTPTPDIGDPPVLKIIPPVLDLPDEIWPNGGRDTTVLAQMVHATDEVIPNDIMTIIWSTIGLLVVGGLITILHK